MLGHGLLLGGIGIIVGAADAAAMTHVLQSLLNDVKPTDPAVFVATGVGVAVVDLLACYLPARSAGRVNPMDILRVE